jgi:hypothetical protein
VKTLEKITKRVTTTKAMSWHFFFLFHKESNLAVLSVKSFRTKTKKAKTKGLIFTTTTKIAKKVFSFM